MKTPIAIFLLVVLCSCGGGGEDSSSTTTTWTETDTSTATGSPRVSESEIAGKSFGYRMIWNHLHSSSVSAWSNFDSSQEKKLRMGIEMGQHAGPVHKLAWKEVSKLAQAFYEVKLTNKEPDFKLIAKTILKEMKQ